MNLLDNSLITVLLTLAATFLGLSIAVQVLQELYKYLRSSKGRQYFNALQDYIGSLAFEIFKTSGTANVKVRGPFQLKRVSPKGLILPLKKDELVNRLERTAEPWVLRTLEQLRLEAEMQEGKKADPSNAFKEFIDELGKVEKGTNGYWKAQEILQFFYKAIVPLKSQSNINVYSSDDVKNNLNSNFDSKQMVIAFSNKFLSYVEEAANNFSQFEKNFEYTYGRANKRLTFIIALIVTFMFNFGINELYKNALETNPADAIALAETTMGIYKNEIAGKDTIKKEAEDLDTGNVEQKKLDSLLTTNLNLLKNIMTETLKGQSSDDRVQYFNDWKSIPDIFRGDFRFFVYLFYCAISSIFITFGAPFWNDIASSLLRLQKGKTTSSSEESNG